MQQKDFDTTSTGRRKRQRLLRCVCRWRTDIAVKSFMKCSISNAIDGTDDDIPFNHNIRSNDEISVSFTSDNESDEDFVDVEPN